jgi:two-component system alkaline phosphatase synthesis response regulator PhoP
MAKILVADDEICVQGLMRDILEAESHQVLTVSNGSDVIPTLKKERPDLLILDVMMPGVDGFSLQDTISKDPELSRIPVIVATAQHSFLQMFKKFRQVTGMLRKPFKNEELIATVKDVLSRRPDPYQR